MLVTIVIFSYPSKSKLLFSLDTIQVGMRQEIITIPNIFWSPCLQLFLVENFVFFMKGECLLFNKELNSFSFVLNVKGAQVERQQGLITDIRIQILINKQKRLHNEAKGKSLKLLYHLEMQSSSKTIYLRHIITINFSNTSATSVVIT